ECVRGPDVPEQHRSRVRAGRARCQQHPLDAAEGQCERDAALPQRAAPRAARRAAGRCGHGGTLARRRGGDGSEAAREAARQLSGAVRFAAVVLGGLCFATGLEAQVQRTSLTSQGFAPPAYSTPVAPSPAPAPLTMPTCEDGPVATVLMG